MAFDVSTLITGGYNLTSRHVIHAVCRFPADLAARIAVETVVAMLKGDSRGVARVMFCCFAEESAAHHGAALAHPFGGPNTK